MNRVEIIGNLVRDVELNKTNSGVSVAKVSVAVDRRYKDEEGNKITDFFNVVAWRGLAENIAKYCSKGSKVFIAGELQNRSWEKEDGSKAYTTEIVASECEFLDTKKTGESTENKEEPKAELTPVEDNGDDLPF